MRSSYSCPCRSGEPSPPNIVALEYQLGLLEIVGPNSQSLDGSNMHRSHSCTGIMSFLAEPSGQIGWSSFWELPQQNSLLQSHRPFLFNWIKLKVDCLEREMDVMLTVKVEWTCLLKSQIWIKTFLFTNQQLSFPTMRKKTPQKAFFTTTTHLQTTILCSD